MIVICVGFVLLRVLSKLPDQSEIIAYDEEDYEVYDEWGDDQQHHLKEKFIDGEISPN